MALATTPVNLPLSSPPITKKLSSSASALQYTGNDGYYNSNIMTLGKQFGRQLTLGMGITFPRHQSCLVMWRNIV